MSIPTQGTAHRSQVILGAATISRLLLSIAVTVFLGRILAPSDYGFFALVSAVLIVGRDLMDLGMGNVAARETAANPSSERSVIEVLLGWRTIVGIIMAVACLVFAFVQGSVPQTWVMCSAALVLTIMHFNSLLPVFQVRQAQGAPAALSVGAQIGFLGACIALFFLHAQAALYAFLVVVREGIVLVGNKVMATALLDFKPRRRLVVNDAQGFFKKALTFGLAAALYNLYFHSGTFLVWLHRPEPELGAFAAAFRPIQPVLALPWILMVPLVPTLTQIASVDRQAYKRLVRGALYLSLGIGSIGAVAGIVLAPEILEILYGEKYSGGDLSAISSFRWFSLALCFAWITPALGTALLVDGMEKSLLRLCASGFVFNITLNLFLLPNFGYPAAAFTTAMTELLVALGALALYWKAARPIGFGFRMLSCLVPAAILLLVFQWLPQPPILQVSLGILFSILGLIALWNSPTAKSYKEELSKPRSNDPTQSE